MGGYAPRAREDSVRRRRAVRPQVRRMREPSTPAKRAPIEWVAAGCALALIVDFPGSVDTHRFDPAAS